VTRSLWRAPRAVAVAVRSRITWAWRTLAWGMLGWSVLAWVAVAGGVAIADPQRPAQDQEPTQLAEGSGRDLTVSRCIVCHSLEYIPSNAPAMNRTAWGKTIQKMRDRFGAPITDDEGRRILEYLATNYSGKP
jgi:sulfite dehydrogenase (cytochrome) subunit B